MIEQKEYTLPSYFINPTDRSVRISPIDLEVLQYPRYFIGLLGKAFYENPNLTQVSHSFRTRIYNSLLRWSGAQKDNNFTPQHSFVELLLLRDDEFKKLGLGQKSLDLFYTAVHEIKDRFIESTAPKPA